MIEFVEVVEGMLIGGAGVGLFLTVREVLVLKRKVREICKKLGLEELGDE